MIEWFTEDSFVPMVVGGMLTLAFLGLAFYFYDRTMLLVAIVIAILTTLTVVIEKTIVTDKEQLTAEVKNLASAVQRNDLAEVLRYVSDSREDVKSRIQAEMPLYQFKSCRVLKVIDFEIESDRRRAKIVFVVFATGTHPSYGTRNAHRRVTLMFEKTPNEQWKFYDYDHEAATQGYRL